MQGLEKFGQVGLRQQTIAVTTPGIALLPDFVLVV
jgi:hypothetical protein